jgi:hypothetical protein
VTVNGIPLTAVSWGPTQIQGTVPLTAIPGGQLVVTRGDNGRFTLTSVTVHMDVVAPLRVTPSTQNIQAVLNAAPGGRLVIFEPGTYDKQLLIVPKPMRLQGSGPGSTFISGTKAPANKLVEWRTAIDALLGATPGSGVVDLLPTQEQAAAATAIEPDTFNTEEGAAITVLGRSDARCGLLGAHESCFGGVGGALRRARIDGFTISGGDSAGAIYVNGWVHGLEISNNIVRGNSGLYHGGVRAGVPFQQGLPNPPAAGYGYNRNLRVHHNAITHNGGLDGAGGGVLLCTGTDGYRVTENWICGNFSQGHGGGIAHFGLSNSGLIERNRILFNQSFNQGLNVHGGGLLVAGEPALGTALSRGAGSVTVNANLIVGNHAGAGHGAGVRVQMVNGMDVVANPGARNQWHRLVLTNNMIVNNVAGWAGGGVSLMDAARVEIENNTIAHNDSTATVGAAFTGPNESAPQVAGLVSEQHSPGLAAAFATTAATAPYRVLSNPSPFRANIFWENRSFHYLVDSSGQGGLRPELAPTTAGACATGASYDDIGVIGAGTLNASANSIVTGTTDPAFSSTYCNGARSARLLPEVTTLQTAPALDEGGNWIDVRYGPITLTRADGSFFGNYHIQAGSPAINLGAAAGPTVDYDNQSRAGRRDAGADEYLPLPELPLP